MFEQWTTYPDDQKPNRAVLYFPACKSDLGAWEARVPTLMLLGAKDNVPVGFTDNKFKPLAEECRRQAAQAGSAIDLRQYPGTYHSFSVRGPKLQIDALIPLSEGGYKFVTYRRDDRSAAAAAKATRDALK